MVGAVVPVDAGAVFPLVADGLVADCVPGEADGPLALVEEEGGAVGVGVLVDEEAVVGGVLEGVGGFAVLGEEEGEDEEGNCGFKQRHG